MRVLVIEDEHRIANTIKEGLEQERYVVDVAYDGEEGYDLAATEEYDAIVLDLMLPKKVGIDVCKDLRKDGIHTPILILTAKSMTKDKIIGLDSGADDYLTKPFSFSELVARLRALSRRPNKTVNETLKVDDLTLDPRMCRVERGGQEIELTNKEYSLLEYLMRNPVTVLSKDQIINNIWNYDADILPNTVEVYVKILRSKIDKPFPKKDPLINTVRGFGYKIG
ncbi:DNA-binding response regulator [Candidatus Woesebacteria bacterium RIFCSPHIGHO2_02_FULL_42_20]|uniref:DNA-binding response regulator n=1 Tax=Candidatus Woesebacteria bacterium RIFCSPHIGHO2_12_FULL_41_24 TaxID=1802510 RepID=A0A1F8AQK1_9BACT|nr:MAG: DNA-binding response regulator [Candidatus Woesebacteria bacterium RBG_16_41_13]OGM30725.1 MAG: DNA-binding response regulator [Candidatus Woesebacteria bacterium RIFCSPHIGHO2_01_FULL_42_80]OGM35862.1 MAG: DNA-binding response regulator [Candidatus Woesebacteria bacterium RIFCSPHIGHO2_02_FULL_42_20]OGM53920.1 MAG: DNA-binding response regulator [Candidatus Woesebacteria bacterium RIFCSPHIGHO2_12_FULL_41_24]OGM66112.1 MAG: DNA-binding response regulator [Candidatus Woesebacteria bacteriu